MNNGSVFSDRQKTIIKDYLESTFFESGPALKINHEQALSRIMEHPDFFSEPGHSRSDLESNESYHKFLDSFFTAGRHQQLLSYEGLQEFFQEHCAINLKSRDYSAEMDGIPDSFNDYSGYHGSSAEQPQAPNDTLEPDTTSVPNNTESNGQPNSVTNKMRDELVQELRAAEPAMATPEPSLTPEQQEQMNIGRSYQQLSQSITGAGAAGTLVAGAALSAVTGMMGNAFGLAGAAFGQEALKRRDMLADRTGRFANAGVAGRVLDRRMKQIKEDEISLKTLIGRLEEKPSSLDLRAGVLAKATSLANKIQRTADLAEKAGDLSPSIKDRVSKGLRGHSESLSKTMEEQKVLKLDRYENLVKTLKAMADKISSVFGFKKNALSSASPSPS